MRTASIRRLPLNTSKYTSQKNYFFLLRNFEQNLRFSRLTLMTDGQMVKVIFRGRFAPRNIKFQVCGPLRNQLLIHLYLDKDNKYPYIHYIIIFILFIKAVLYSFVCTVKGTVMFFQFFFYVGNKVFPTFLRLSMYLETPILRPLSRQTLKKKHVCRSSNWANRFFQLG